MIRFDFVFMKFSLELWDVDIQTKNAPKIDKIAIILRNLR